MMQRMLNVVRGSLLGKSLAVGAALACTAAVPQAAFAHHGFHVDVDVPVAVEVTPVPCDAGRIWVEPVYQTVLDRQWIEPVYQTVTERVWVPATTSVRVERVFVPAQYGWRDVVSCDYCGNRRVYRQQILVSPAHYEHRQVGCVEIPAHFEDVQRQQLVTDGHWQTVQRQVLVTPGHWEMRLAPGPVMVAPQATARFEVRLPF